MSNIFSNVNLKVKEQKVFHSSSAADTSMMKLYSNMRANKQDAIMAKNNEIAMENARRADIQSTISAGQTLESYLTNLGIQLYKEGREVIFKDIMMDIYLESVYLDDSFKEEYSDSIKSTMAEYIDKNGGFAMLEAACKKEKTKLLCDMKDVVEKTARQCSMRKINELKEACGSKTEACKSKTEACGSKTEACKSKTEACGSKTEACKSKTEACGSKTEACKSKTEACAPKGKGVKAMEIMNCKHSFNMTDKEREDYLKSREKLSEEEIVKLVRDKVLTVVTDEKNRQADMERFEEEIQQRADELENSSEEQKKAFKESMMQLSSKNTFTDMTLFEAIQVSTMKELMEATSKCESKDDEDDIFDEEFGDICDDDENCDDEIDMDLVLAESITKYTLLEVCNTLRLEKFSRNSVQQLCLNLSK